MRGLNDADCAILTISHEFAKIQSGNSQASYGRSDSASLASCCSKIRSRESNKLIGNYPFVFYPVSVSCFRGCCQGESILLAESCGTGSGDGGLGSTSRVSRMGNVAQQGGNGANSCVAQRSSEIFLGHLGSIIVTAYALY